MIAGNTRRATGAALALAALLAGTAHADERKFTYSYEPRAGRKGEVEFEQWLTGKLGRESGDYAKWEFVEELEFGLTGRLDTSLLLTFDDVYESDSDETQDDGLNFKSIGSEWKYLFVNPYMNPIGVSGYLEAKTDGAHEFELEEKLILGSYGKEWAAVMNITMEQEWESEGGETEEESALDVTAGLSRKLSEAWSVGLEVLHARGYIDGVDLSEEEYNATYVGPNVLYTGDTWWSTLTVMPQVYGEGDGADDNLQLEHRERVEIRLLAGVHL